MLLHAMSLLLQQRPVDDIEHLADKVSFTVLPPLSPLEVQPGDFSKSRALIDRSLDCARSFLDSGASSATAVERMRPHRHG